MDSCARDGSARNRQVHVKPYPVFLQSPLDFYLAFRWSFYPEFTRECRMHVPEPYQLNLFSKAEQGGAPIGDPIPVNLVQSMEISDAGALIFVPGGQLPVPMESLGKIIFSVPLKP